MLHNMRLLNSEFYLLDEVSTIIVEFLQQL